MSRRGPATGPRLTCGQVHALVTRRAVLRRRRGSGAAVHVRTKFSRESSPRRSPLPPALRGRPPRRSAAATRPRLKECPRDRRSAPIRSPHAVPGARPQPRRRLRVEPPLDERQPDSDPSDHARHRRERVERQQHRARRRPRRLPAPRSRRVHPPACRCVPCRRSAAEPRLVDQIGGGQGVQAGERLTRRARPGVSKRPDRRLARNAPCTTGWPSAAPERMSSSVTSAPASPADAHAPRSDDSADTSAERRRAHGCRAGSPPRTSRGRRRRTRPADQAAAPADHSPPQASRAVPSSGGAYYGANRCPSTTVRSPPCLTKPCRICCTRSVVSSRVPNSPRPRTSARTRTTGGGRPAGVLGESGGPAAVGLALGEDVGVGRAVREVVRRRDAQRSRELRGPTRERRARRPGGDPLRGRAGRHPHDHLRRTLDEVCQAANALTELGVRAGDRVAIYLPMIPEAVVAMLACARIGAPHSVVFGGFSARRCGPDRRRRRAGWSSPPTAATGGVRPSALKPAVDEALAEGEPDVRHVLVVRRRQGRGRWTEGRDVWWHERRGRPVDRARAGGVRRRAPAVHPLHVGHDREAQGDPAHDGRLSDPGGLHAPCGVRPQAGRPTSTGARRTSAGSPATLHRLRAAREPVPRSCMYEGTPDTPHQGRFWEIDREVPGHDPLHRPDRDPHVHEVGRGYPGAASTCRRCGCSGSVGEPINPEAWIWYRRVIGGGPRARSSTPGGRPRPARS